MNKLKCKYKIGVICGDLRSIYMAAEFQNMGFEVCAYGLLDDEISLIGKVYDSPQRVIESSDVIILPLPATKDNIYVFSKSPNIKIKLSDIANEMNDKKIIFGGILPKYFCDMCRDVGCEVIDYYGCENLVYKNATATAEGAVMIAMSNTPDTVKDSKYSIIGYGRIAKQLAYMLKSLGGNITIMARSDMAIADAIKNGYRTFKLESIAGDEYYKKMAEVIDSCSVVFNTVPSIILNEEVLKKQKNLPIYVELASSPGGIDSEYARIKRIKNIYAPSLPGRYAPRSAGKYIFEEIIRLLSDKQESEVI